jgi:ribosome-associated protein
MSNPRSRRAEGGPSPKIDAKEKALCCARWALEKKAYGIVLLNVGPMTPITEYFVICSGRSVRQTRAVVEHIRTRLKQELHYVPLGVEGETEGCWILLDCDDVVVHVFFEPTRDVYRLEHLWSDAPLVQDPLLADQEGVAARRGSKEDEEDWED